MILRGQAFWPKVFEGSLTGDETKYQVDICHLDEDTVKQLEDHGLTVKIHDPKKEHYKGTFITARGNRETTVIPGSNFSENYAITLKDVDTSIMKHVKEVMKLKVENNGETNDIPIMYANPERWKTIQRDGHIRDSKKQLITPLVVFRRTSLAKDDTIAVDKMNAEDPKLSYTFERKYTQENRYDQFSVLQGKKPSQEFYTVAMPDYMNLTYECIIWTSYIEQMNKIVERINWSDGSYWGEPNKFKFQSRIESFEDATEMADNERIVKTTFSFTFRGYLIPESFNDYINTKKYLTPQQIVTEGEFEFGLSSIFQPDSRAQTVRVFGQRSSTLGSLAGATDFIRGVSPGYGNAPQDLEFTNTYGGRTYYIMRGSGEPTSSRDDKAVISVSNANSTYNLKSFRVSGSQSSSLSASQGQIYQPTLESERRIMSSSVQVKLNGLELTSANDQVGYTSGFDYYLSSSYKDVVIRKRQSDNTGFTITDSDYVTIIFQSEIT